MNLSPEVVVQAYATSLATCLGALHSEFEGAWRDAGTTPLMLHPRDDRPALRQGRLAEIGQFQLHGFGCRIERLDGAIVDFDWGFDGRVHFDSWRLWLFADSIGASALTREALEGAVGRSQLVESRGDGWYSLVEW